MPDLKRALVVEDDEPMRVLMVQRLEMHGLVVDAAECWIDGKRFLTENRYAVVVCDNRMPQRVGELIRNNKGLELLEWVRRGSELNKEVPFIMHSSDEESDVLPRLTAQSAQFSPKGGRPKYYEMVAELIKNKN